MAELLRILSVATVAVHLTMGCCWHHAHGCEDGRNPATARDSAVLGVQCPDSYGCQSDHGSSDCRQPKCSFVFPNRSILSAADVPDRLTLTASLDAEQFRESIGSQQCFVTASRLLMPVRLHLANQVLLI
jgi:hypothetical protein